MKIEKLTREQEGLLTVYRDKWMAIGLSTEPANRKEAERGIEIAYANKGLKKPKMVWCMSPLSQGLTRYAVMNIKQVPLGKSLGDSVRDSVWDSVWDSVRASVYGQHEAGALGFYDYFNNVLKLEKQTIPLEGLWIQAQNAGWFLPHENICWISERHNICNLKNGVIHTDGGPAIAYPDGFKIWALNGVRVPQYLAETPEGQLDIEFFKKEENSDIKAEFIRKYGVERMQSLGKKICDAKNHSNEWFRKSEYELINMGAIFGIDYAPHLRMRNLTTGIWHFEAVSPDCKTIEDALKFRARGKTINLKGVA